MSVTAIRLLFAAIGLASCVELVPPEPPPSNPSGATCDEACANLEELGCVDSGLVCAQDCREIESVEGDFVQVKELDKGCLAAAKTCQEASACE